jgi:hypothetical protein
LSITAVKAASPLEAAEAVATWARACPEAAKLDAAIETARKRRRSNMK